MSDELSERQKPEEKVEMSPEPALIINGVAVNDYPLHATMLENEEANRVADILAMHIAVELGFSPEEAMRLCQSNACNGPSTPLADVTVPSAAVKS